MDRTAIATAVALYHYTCRHGYQEIGDRGTLLPAIKLAHGGAHRLPAHKLPPNAPGAHLVWLTDLDAPYRAVLGLMPTKLHCDRTRYRYRVTGGHAVPWTSVRRDHDKAMVAMLESAVGAMPRHWWVSSGPVPVVYSPAGVG